ncbi:class I SAM-dependent methyltransferase [Robertmurraya sp. P23]|uniref:class I SAM-dependent methyltransferase n=1 Tax=Robertmurraya sp. P23 TaxID=3436931 RepID=UPI003D99ABCB
MGNRFAKWYDFFMSPFEKGRFKSIRRDLLQKANGLVLEVGSGTGANFPYYPSGIEVIAIEPNQHMIKRSSKKLHMSKAPIKIIEENGERLPFTDNTFDTVVATLVLCTIPNQELALSEMKRVCKSEGKILLFEHIKMRNPFLAKLQDWLTPFWKRVCDGCCLNRDTVQMINENGLTITEKKTYYKGLFVQLELRNQK